MCEFVGAAGTPVTAGCAGPLLRPPSTPGSARRERTRRRGAAGGGASPEPGHAVDFIVDTLAARPGEITLVATGPLTNIALAVKREPRITEWVRYFVIMGGSAGRGNVTPAAEFNIWVDPEAASIVFDAGWTVDMLGLDVTLRTGPPRRCSRGCALGDLGTGCCCPRWTQYKRRSEAVGPPCTTSARSSRWRQPSLFGLVRPGCTSRRPGS